MMSEKNAIVKSAPMDKLEKCGFNTSQAMRIRDRWLSCLPDMVGRERFFNIAVSVMTDPKLQKCTQESKIVAVYGAARMGLIPDDVLGQAYVLPFKNQAKLIIGYKGFIELFNRQPNFRSIQAHVIFSGDKYDINLGTVNKITHKPWWLNGEAKRGEPVCAYAVADMVGKSKVIEPMSREEIEAVRAKSAAFKFGRKDSPWLSSFWDSMEMWKKTVIKRISKKLPVDPEGRIALAREVDDAGEFGKSQVDIIGYDSPDESPQEGSFGFGKRESEQEDEFANEISEAMDKEADDGSNT